MSSVLPDYKNFGYIGRRDPKLVGAPALRPV